MPTKRRARISTLARDGAGAQIVTLGTEMVVHAQNDARFRDVVNASAPLALRYGRVLLAVRGAAVRSFASASPASSWSNVSARRPRAKGCRSIFSVAREGVGRCRRGDLGSALPRTCIVAGTRNGYFRDDETPAIVGEIRSSGARLLFVGLGSPRQEFWLAEHLRETGCGAGDRRRRFVRRARRARRARAAFHAAVRSRVALSFGEGTAALAPAARVAAFRLARRARRTRLLAGRKERSARESDDSRRRPSTQALSAHETGSQAAGAGRRRSERRASDALSQVVRLRRDRDQRALPRRCDRRGTRRRFARSASSCTYSYEPELLGSAGGAEEARRSSSATRRSS